LCGIVLVRAVVGDLGARFLVPSHVPMSTQKAVEMRENIRQGLTDE
jgi:hypothetical protein